MGRVSKYPEELRERAVRMVAEVRPQYPSQWAAITAVAGMLGIDTPETLRTWIRRAEVDTGQRPGVTSQMAEENKALRKQVAELRRAEVSPSEWSSCYATLLPDCSGRKNRRQHGIEQAAAAYAGSDHPQARRG